MYAMRGFGAVMNAASVKTAQQEINVALVAQGFLPIKVDGIIGPKTCGAARAVGHPSVTAMGCKSFTEPARSPSGPPIPPPGPNAPPGPVPVGPVPGPLAPATNAGMFGLEPKTILIGAGVLGLGIVVVYYLKKKQAAAA